MSIRNSLSRDSADSLAQDGDFSSPLERVNFEAGMLLGVEATRDEQSYHRRRLNRREYWLQGSGTLLGLGVSTQGDAGDDPEANTRVDLHISPGIGIDGLGREVSNCEPYCLNLGEWFSAQLDSPAGNPLIQDGLEADNSAISLLVTMRQQSCATGLQPVLARKLNAGTDPVLASRQRSGICLELIPGPVPERDDAWPWRGHRARENYADLLTDAEESYINSQPLPLQTLLRAQGERVYALPNHNRALDISGDAEDLARTLLAHVRVPLRAASLPDIDPIINTARIEVNNLVRRFIHTADQLAWLRQQGELS